MPNSSLPLVVRRGAIPPSAGAPTKTFKTTFANNGWTNAWLGGIVSGLGQVRFGGEDGELVSVTMGDVIVIPAGVAHALINGSDDFAAAGAYPGGVGYDMVREDPKALNASQHRIAQVPLPDAHPVGGADGLLTKLWT